MTTEQAIILKAIPYQLSQAEIHSARAVALPGRGDVLYERLKKVSEASRQEKGCVAYEWYRVRARGDAGTSDTDTFISFEVFADAEALQAHLTSAHFHAFFDEEKRDPCLSFAGDSSLRRVI